MIPALEVSVEIFTPHKRVEAASFGSENGRAQPSQGEN